MATKTFDPNRVGGGTFELVQDPATGKYSYNKVGFQPLKSLTIPDLGTPTTTPPKIGKPVEDDADISKPFEQLSKQTGGGGGEGIDYTGQMLKEARKINPQLQMTRDNLTSSFIGEERPTKTYSEQLAELQRGTAMPPMLGDRGGSMDQMSGVTTQESDKPMGPGSSNPKRPGQGTLSTATETATLTGPKPGAGDLRGFSKNRTTARPTEATITGASGTDKTAMTSDAAQLGISKVESTQPTIGSFGTDPTAANRFRGVSKMGALAGEGEKEDVKPEPTGLKKVSTGLKSLSDSVGAILSSGPIMTLAKAAFTETPVNKHDKKYFNVRGGSVDGQRIAGNPATDLYAGFNRVSAFGNLEKAGNKRIATREKTIAKKGYGPGDKFYDDTQNMKKQASNYKASKQKATQGPAGGATTGGGGNGGGGGGGRVICTELNETGDLSTKDLIRDIKFTYKNLSKKHLKGYLAWAIPTVGHIKKYPKYRKIWKHVAQHRANDIAWRMKEGKFDLLGRIYAGIGEPLCWLIGNFVSDTNYNLLNNKRNRHL